MDRRTFLSSALATIAVPAIAQQDALSLPGGTQVFANDGAFVGVFRSGPRETRKGLRLFINPRRSRVFRRMGDDVFIDLPASKVSVGPSGLVIAADTLELRNSLYYRRELNEPGRVFLSHK